MTALLVDEGISHDLVVNVVQQGVVAYHWLDLGAKRTHDSVIFREAQQRGLTVFTLNREDFIFVATCWRNWNLGNHHGVIAPRKGKQPSNDQQLRAMLRYGADQSSFNNRIVLF
jgi:predicted nuclease of predicted toxin-antitoxin system